MGVKAFAAQHGVDEPKADFSFVVSHGGLLNPARRLGGVAVPVVPVVLFWRKPCAVDFATPFGDATLMLVLRRGFLRLFTAFSPLAGVFISYIGTKYIAK